MYNLSDLTTDELNALRSKRFSELTKEELDILSDYNELWLRHQLFGDMTDEEIESKMGLDWDALYSVYCLDEYWRD